MDYEDFKSKIKEGVLESLNMTEKQFVTDGFVKIIQCTTNEKSERTVVCFDLLEANSYSCDKILEYMPPCFRHERYAYERDFIREMSKAMNPYEGRSEEEKYDMIIETHIAQFLQGTCYSCVEQNFWKNFEINEEIFKFSREKGTSPGNQSHFTYLNASAEVLSSLKNFDEFVKYLISEIVTFSKNYNFYLFVEIENPELKEKIKMERMKDEIISFLNSLTNKEKGIELLEEVLKETKKEEKNG